MLDSSTAYLIEDVLSKEASVDLVAASWVTAVVSVQKLDHPVQNSHRISPGGPPFGASATGQVDNLM